MMIPSVPSEPNPYPETATQPVGSDRSIPRNSSPISTISRDESAGDFVVSDLPPGYRMVRKLGHGGMGDVFEVVDEHLGMTYALKMIRSQKLSDRLLERFRREAIAIQKLEHRHVVRFYHFGVHNGIPYLVMKFLNGGTLKDKLSEYQKDRQLAVEVLVKIADAIQYLHQQGYIHRDLKPGNVLLDEQGEPYVCDFGLVKAINDEHHCDSQGSSDSSNDPSTIDSVNELTQPGDILGTRAYMAPEQIIGDLPNIAAPSDIWAFGVMAYELLAGQKPFVAEETETLNRSIRQVTPPSPSQIQPDLDPSLAEGISRCLQKSPQDRWPSIQLFQQVLQSWLDQQRPKPSSRKMSRWEMLAISLFFGCVSALIVWGMQKNQETPQPSGPSRQEIIRDLKDRLERGETLSLIDEKKNLIVPPKFILGDGITQIRKDQDGYPTLDCSSLAMMECLPDLGIDSYRIRVRMRSFQGPTNPIGGLYFSFQQHSTELGDYLHFVDYRFLEPPQLNSEDAPGQIAPTLKKQSTKTPLEEATLPPTPSQGFVEMKLRGQLWKAGEQFGNSSPSLDAFKIDRLPKTNFRSLEVDVSPQQFLFRWNGEAHPPIARSTIQRLQRNATLLKGFKPFPPLFSGAGGFGILVSGGAVSIQQIEILPLAP